MPSPFPGMDPYLEGPEWTGFHASLAVEIAWRLTSRIRPKYVAKPQKRFYMADLRSDPVSAMEGCGFTHTWVEICDVSDRQLVTTIEILSPWNKRGQGQEEYLERRRRLLDGSSHLVEIDLLRLGERLPVGETLPQGSYYVFVGRANERPKVEIWPISLRNRLPTFGVPLLVDDADVALDLQTCFQNVYDLGGFDLLLDYTKPPSVPLNPDDAAWAAEMLKAAKHEQGDHGDGLGRPSSDRVE